MMVTCGLGKWRLSRFYNEHHVSSMCSKLLQEVILKVLLHNMNINVVLGNMVTVGFFCLSMVVSITYILSGVLKILVAGVHGDRGERYKARGHECF